VDIFSLRNAVVSGYDSQSSQRRIHCSSCRKINIHTPYQVPEVTNQNTGTFRVK